MCLIRSQQGKAASKEDDLAVPPRRVPVKRADGTIKSAPVPMVHQPTGDSHHPHSASILSTTATKSSPHHHVSRLSNGFHHISLHVPDSWRKDEKQTDVNSMTTQKPQSASEQQHQSSPVLLPPPTNVDPNPNTNDITFAGPSPQTINWRHSGTNGTVILSTHKPSGKSKSTREKGGSSGGGLESAAQWEEDQDGGDSRTRTTKPRPTSRTIPSEVVIHPPAPIAKGKERSTSTPRPRPVDEENEKEIGPSMTTRLTTSRSLSTTLTTTTTATTTMNMTGMMTTAMTRTTSSSLLSRPNPNGSRSHSHSYRSTRESLTVRDESGEERRLYRRSGGGSQNRIDSGNGGGGGGLMNVNSNGNGSGTVRVTNG